MNPAAAFSRSLHGSLAILTRIPVRDGGAAGSTGAATFGLVGGLIGVAGAVPLVVAGAAAPWVAAILAISVTTILSGGLHLDGLADTTDALLAADPAKAEVARKDPAIGAGGAIALILVLGAQVAALASLAGLAGAPSGTGPASPATDPTRAVSLLAGLACITAGAGSRAVALVAVRTWRSRTAAGGFGGWFAARIGWPATIVSAATAGVIALAAGAILRTPAVPLAVAAGALAGLGIAAAVIRTRGQLDGDGMGAIVELSSAAILIALALAMTAAR